MNCRSKSGGIVGSAVVGAFLGVACGNHDHQRGCTVEQHDDGSATITCDDGTNATVVGGQDGRAGKDGRSGEPGATGMQGEPGADGSSCTLVDQSGGARVLECSDGTSAVVRPGGASGLGGAANHAHFDSVFYGASSFVAASADQATVALSATGDYAYLEDGNAPYYNSLLAPVHLPQGVEVYQMTCFYFDNTSLGDLDAQAEFYVRPLDAESGVEGIRMTMTTTDFVATQMQSVTASPPAELIVDNDARAYFVRVYWSTGDRPSSAVRFYGCSLDFGAPGE